MFDCEGKRIFFESGLLNHPDFPFVRDTRALRGDSRSHVRYSMCKCHCSFKRGQGVNGRRGRDHSNGCAYKEDSRLVDAGT